MTNEGDGVGAGTTTNVRPDGGKKSKKGKKQLKGNEVIVADPTPSDVQTSHPPPIVDVSDEDTGEDAVDVAAGEDWLRG